MRKIEVFLPSSMDGDGLSERLLGAGAVSVSITLMRIFNKQQQRADTYRGARCAARPISELKVEIVVDPDSLSPVTEILHEIMGETEQGSRRVFVTDLVELSAKIGVASEGGAQVC